jgi:hypothetical protein
MIVAIQGVNSYSSRDAQASMVISPRLHLPEISPSAERFGFSAKLTGGHMARSMMLTELSILLRAVPSEAKPPDYKRAILSDNVLGKPTFSSRDKSYKHLAQLYTLDPNFALFRALRRLAADDPASLPLIAMTCTFCRDAQLRHSFALIEQLNAGAVLPRERMEEHLEAGFPGRFSSAMKESLARNVNTTWTAAGHLAGKARKVRTLPQPRLAASLYAMFAGYLLGLRGEILLQSVFARLVAPDASVIVAHLTAASSRGWLRFRHAGGVVEVDFSPLLTSAEQRHLHGTH